MSYSKIFVIGLPRTGTTSVCTFLLNQGLNVAHTAYCQQAFQQAQVIADTPIFHDFKKLDGFYNESKFIYLERSFDHWLPSIRQLLIRMHDNLLRDSGGFNPIIKRCYLERFSPFSMDNLTSDEFLSSVYQSHLADAKNYFVNREQDFLLTDVSTRHAANDINEFLSLSNDDQISMPHLNRQGKVTAWKDVKSEHKIASTHKGRPTPLDYLR